MERDRILGILREHQEEFEAAGLLHLRLFGSVARGDNTPASDVDLLFEYDESQSWNLLRAYGLSDYVAAMLCNDVRLGPTHSPGNSRKGSAGGNSCFLTTKATCRTVLRSRRSLYAG